jgi:hypothetical protein
MIGLPPGGDGGGALPPGPGGAMPDAGQPTPAHAILQQIDDLVTQLESLPHDQYKPDFFQGVQDLRDSLDGVQTAVEGDESGAGEAPGAPDTGEPGEPAAPPSKPKTFKGASQNAAATLKGLNKKKKAPRPY